MRVGLTQHDLLDKYVNAIALSTFVKVLKKFVIQTLFDVLLSNQKCRIFIKSTSLTFMKSAEKLCKQNLILSFSY